MYKNTMGLIIMVILSLNTSLFGDAYEKNCMKCHKRMKVGIDKFFYRYLLNYSSKEKVKEAIKKYLKNPKKEESLLADGLILRFGVKRRTRLNDKKLDEALEIYWKKYNLIDKLK